MLMRNQETWRVVLEMRLYLEEWVVVLSDKRSCEVLSHRQVLRLSLEIRVRVSLGRNKTWWRLIQVGHLWIRPVERVRLSEVCRVIETLSWLERKGYGNVRMCWVEGTRIFWRASVLTMMQNLILVVWLPCRLVNTRKVVVVRAIVWYSSRVLLQMRSVSSSLVLSLKFEHVGSFFSDTQSEWSSFWRMEWWLLLNKFSIVHDLDLNLIEVVLLLISLLQTRERSVFERIPTVVLITAGSVVITDSFLDLLQVTLLVRLLLVLKSHLANLLVQLPARPALLIATELIGNRSIKYKIF